MQLRRVLLILVGLLVAGLGAAAWLLPSRIDWRERRAEIEAAAAGVLGRPVQLREEFSLSLLPAPRIAARGLSVADVGDGFSIEAREVRLKVLTLAPADGPGGGDRHRAGRTRIALFGISPPPFPPAWPRPGSPMPTCGSRAAR